MLVYRGNFNFNKIIDLNTKKYFDTEDIDKIYVNILLSNEVQWVKNIQHNEHKFELLTLDFPQLGMNFFSPFGNIYYYYRRFKRPLISLFKYMCYLKKGYKFRDNKNPYFVTDYEFNVIKNEHIFQPQNYFSYFTSISRSSGKAIFKAKSNSKELWENYNIINKSVFDIKSNKFNYISKDSVESDYLGIDANLGGEFNEHSLYIYKFDILYENKTVKYYFKIVKNTIEFSSENIDLYFIYKFFYHQGLIHKVELTIDNFYEYYYKGDSKYDFLKLWRALYKSSYNKNREIKIIKLITENKSKVKVYKCYLLYMHLGNLNQETMKALKLYIKDPKFSKFKFQMYSSGYLHIYIDESMFNNIINKYNNFF